MRTLGTLIVLFLIFGVVNPFMSSIGYTQTSVEQDLPCASLGMDVPGVSFSGQGYVFRGYLVNLYTDRSGTRVPSCPDQLQTNSSYAWTFMEWPV
ncbi:MAG: hypothetical protein KBC22_01425 [Candidatus Pacebacteria bacterium]|nr:hypothetical protein [Candidatus Paceibacterota bacterium]